MFEFEFMQRAMAASLVIGVLCGLLGFFVVLRRLAFIGVGISHSAVGGVAIGLLAGVDPLLTAAVFAILVALGIARTSRSGALSEDAVIGVFFSGSMALGVVLFSMRRGFQQDLFGYLFGNVLTISSGELAALTVVAVGVSVVLILIFKELLFIAYDEEVARAYGRPVDALNTTLLVLLAITIIVGVRLVGVLLIEALLVIPAATASLWSERFRTQVLLSALIGAGSASSGLALAYGLDIAAGGSMVLVGVVLFFGSVLLRRVPT